MAHEPALNLPNPWAAVGRDTEAGRALFALYNGFGHARSRGNDYSQMNRMKHLRHIAVHGVPEFPVPKPLPPKKPEVKVPHFPHKNYNSDDYHPVDFIPRRRRAAEILQQIRDDSYVVEMPPMPKGPLLDEAEKARLQEVFYWSNRNLGPEPPVAEPVRRLPKKGSVEEQELLLNEIAREIEDREAFLNEMEEYGKGEQYRSQIMFEIQQRVGQMKLLHENITAQEKENEKKSEKATPQASYTTPPPKSHARGQARNANTTLRFNPNTGLSPHFDHDPRFDRSSYTTSRADEMPGHGSSRHETSTASHTDPCRTTTRTDTPEPSTPNVIRTASCYGNAPAASMTESQPPTPPPSTKHPAPAPAPTKTILNLNLNLNSPPNSAGGSYTASPNGSAARSSSSIRIDPWSKANARFQQSAGRSSDRYTSGVASNNSNVNYPSGPTPWNNSCPTAYGSPARSPSSICSDPRSRPHCVRFQQSGDSEYMSDVPPNSYPSGTTAWNECSPSSAAGTSPSAFRSHSRSGANVRFEGDSDRFMSGVTSNSKVNFPSQSTPWDECPNSSDARSPSSISSDLRSRAHCVRFQQSGNSEPMSGVPWNSNIANYVPSRSTRNWDGGCSPVVSPGACHYDRDN